MRRGTKLPRFGAASGRVLLRNRFEEAAEYAQETDHRENENEPTEEALVAARAGCLRNPGHRFRPFWPIGKAADCYLVSQFIIE